ncbi:MAG: helix-turn-helix transcriptional regulator [Bdellovibrionaceae bacterium]|nr:helix-turn-helix transcriptional regulator [Pseudobdellovibrionaceae bacterium]
MPDFRNLSRNLADNLVGIRQKRSMTQDNLAHLSGLPRSTIANLESGEGNPSLVNLAKLASALSVQIDELLMPAQAVCKLIEADQVPYHEKMQGAVKVLKLLPDPIGHMEMDRMEIKSGGILKGTPHRSGTREYCHCIQGELTVHVEGHAYHLKKGDVFAFPGDSKHSYSNEEKLNVIAISVVVIAPVVY